MDQQVPDVCIPVPSRREALNAVARTLDSGRLSTIHCIMMQILAVKEDPNASVTDLAEIFSADAPSSARLLRWSNSTLHATVAGGKVESLEEAIIRLGFNRALEVLMSATICDLFSGGPRDGGFTLQALWLNSVAVASGCRLIYSYELGEPAGTAYLAGLLHNLGVVLACQALPNNCVRTALTRHREHDSRLVDEEPACFGATHEEFGDLIARRWRFPDVLVDVMAHHHDWEGVGPRSERLLRVLQLSRAMCCENEHGYPDAPSADLAAVEANREELGINQGSYNLLRQQLADEIRNKQEQGLFH